ncbi:DUF1289 domain-containing protein [Halomonas sp. E19]|uniref:DUF1289 domain-containing protein n=1 Tax=Halomonas sp. E19 TaxID=3397247 RepID=UPI00403353C4
MKKYEAEGRGDAMSERVSSPCVGLCSTTLGDPICRGCQRSDADIVGWFAMTSEQRSARMLELDGLREQVAARYLRIVDAERLTAQMTQHRVRFRPEQPPLSRAIELLRVGRGRMQTLSRYGLQARGDAASWSIVELHERLSEALLQEALRQGSPGPLR